MQNPNLSRRQLLVAGGATLATLALFNTRFAAAAPLPQSDEVIPWLDQPEENQEPEGIVSMNTKTLRPGVYTIQHKSSGRYVDAYTTRKDFALITRPARDYVPDDGHLFFDPPTWVITPVGGVYTIQQKRGGRFVDAHEIAEKDFAVVTRPAQSFDDTQKWILNPLGDNTFTIQQKSSGRFVDAHEIAQKDFALVTRRAQNNDTQRWIILEFFPEG
jgi:hypothetical protein